MLSSVIALLLGCRYVGGYANQHAPLNAPGIQQRAFFEDHFQAMYSQLGGRVVALQARLAPGTTCLPASTASLPCLLSPTDQSLTFGHSMAQSGAFTVVGCESAQALVNAQLFYAVARGAAKQYGTLYFVSRALSSARLSHSDGSYPRRETCQSITALVTSTIPVEATEARE